MADLKSNVLIHYFYFSSVTLLNGIDGRNDLKMTKDLFTFLCDPLMELDETLQKGGT